MNYRHAYHAGNFADLVKHAGLLRLLALMKAGTQPLTVIDTHAGRGLYDMRAPETVRSGEAQAGMGRLIDADDLPEIMQPLKDAVVRASGGEGAGVYPGSPWLIAEALAARGTYIACELRPEEHTELAEVLKDRKGVRTSCTDGYGAAVERCPETGRVLILIDPPFEKPDDYRRIVSTLRGVARKNATAVVMIWLPIKDLETFDHFLREAEDLEIGPLTIAEARIRPLDDPMRMNGCALVVARAPEGLDQDLKAICRWTVDNLGQDGQARVWKIL